MQVQTKALPRAYRVRACCCLQGSLCICNNWLAISACHNSCRTRMIVTTPATALIPCSMTRHGANAAATAAAAASDGIADEVSHWNCSTCNSSRGPLVVLFLTYCSLAAVQDQPPALVHPIHYKTKTAATCPSFTGWLSSICHASDAKPEVHVSYLHVNCGTAALSTFCRFQEGM